MTEYKCNVCNNVFTENELMDLWIRGCYENDYFIDGLFDDKTYYINHIKVCPYCRKDNYSVYHEEEESEEDE